MKNLIAKTADNYLPRVTDLKNTEALKDHEELKEVANLPKVELFDAITEVIRTLLIWSMSLTIIAIVVAAIYMLIAQGEDEEIAKGKKIMLYLVIGMAIMASAYAVVVGITQFKFFN